jgi:predicted TIM-barrel fold metal-dependent hydrolase
MQRRSFLAATAAAALPVPAAPLPFPVIDCHIHLFDTERPGGVPWPPKTNKVLYKPALPDRYRKLATPFGIKGAIEVECSPLVEDNQWVLDTMGKDPIMVGTIGDLEPGKPDFRKHLDRFRANPLFLGIRYGTLWGRKFHDEVRKPEFISDMKFFAAAGLTLDSATSSPALIRDLVWLTDQVPDSRIVIDHLPQMNPPEEPAARKVYEADLVEIGKRKQVYVKISEVLRRVDGKVIHDLSFYRPRLDQLFGVFGEDRVLFGSDWPNSDNWAEYPQVFAVVRDYFVGKGRKVAEKYFWRNSVKAYRWKRRDKSQPDPKKA